MIIKWKNLSQSTTHTKSIPKQAAVAKVTEPPRFSAGMEAGCTPRYQPNPASDVSTYYAAYSDSTVVVDDKTSVFALPRNLRRDPMDLWAADHAAEVRAAAEDMRTDDDEDCRGDYRAAASQLWKKQPQTVRDEYRVRAATRKGDDKKLPSRFE